MAADHHQQYLEITDRLGKTQRFLLDDSPITIGRGTDAKLRLPSNDVSREHAELAVNDLGQWSVRDLQSRNGTYVNNEQIAVDGDDVNWQLLEPGDEIQIEDYRLVLMTSTPMLDEAMGQELSFFNVDMGDDDASLPINTLDNAGNAQISPIQIEAIGSLGLRMVQTRSAIKRIKALFSFLLSEELGGLAAMAMRINKLKLTEPPRMLVSPHFADDWTQGRRPHISRTAMRAVLAQGKGVLIGGSGSGGMELSVQPDVASAVIACPLRNDEASMDFLYLVLKPEVATSDWLALVTLACRQYEITELARALRKNK